MITDFISEYRKEESSPKLSGVSYIDAMRVRHTAEVKSFPDFRVANGIEDDWLAKDENGTKRRYKPMAFMLQRPRRSGDMQQSMYIWVSGVGGQVWDVISGMRRSERVDPIKIDLYRYMSTYTDGPVGPVERYYTVGAESQTHPETGEEQVAIECTAQPIHNQASGEYYTAERFPHLVLASETR